MRYLRQFFLAENHSKWTFIHDQNAVDAGGSILSSLLAAVQGSSPESIQADYRNAGTTLKNRKTGTEHKLGTEVTLSVFDERFLRILQLYR